MRNFILRQTLEKLQTLQRSLKQQLAEQAQLVRQAIESGGGTHDNAMYDSELHKQKVLAERENVVSRYLEEPVVVDELSSAGDKVTVGKRVDIRRLDDSREQSIVILGSADCEFGEIQGAISCYSPLGRRLVGHEEGDAVTIRAPGGSYDVEILRIRPFDPASSG